MMFKKSFAPVVFNILLAFFITLSITLFVQLPKGGMTVNSFAIGMVQGFCISMTTETVIDLGGFGNWFVRRFGLGMESAAAYFVRNCFIVILQVLLMSGLMLFCQVGFSLGLNFFAAWVSDIPKAFLVAYLTALVTAAPSARLAQVLCTGEVPAGEQP